MSTKKAKKRKSSNPSFRTSKTKQPPHYITHRGYTYERLSKKTREVEFDLAEDVLTKIDNLITSGTYVSRGDAVRDILRRMIESKEPIE